MNQALLAFFLSPKSYVHAVTTVEHFETHISHIFLAGDRAYKVKKSLHLDFLDFSTLDLRRHFCEEELRLNKAMAPMLYREVYAVSQKEVGFELRKQSETKASDTIVEYVLCMERFETDNLFLNLLHQDALTESHFLALVDTIVQFQMEAVVESEGGSTEELLALEQANIEVCAQVLVEESEQAVLQRVLDAFEQILDLRHALIEERRKTHVRWLHGDLHLRNICMFRGEPTLFDRIEFNQDLAVCDVWSDFAFLLMDLDYRNRSDIHTFSLNAYLERTDDYSGLQLAGLFLAYRASVRAKVCSLKSTQEQSQKEKEDRHQAALAHITLAQKYLQRKPKFVLLCGGLSGSGKSTLASELACRTAAVHIRSDVIRKHLYGLDRYQKAPSWVYEPNERDRVYAALLERAALVLDSGFSLIVDSVFGHPSFRDRVSTLAKEKGIPVHCIWCTVPDAIAKKRLAQRENDASDADIAVYLQQRQEVHPPEDWRVYNTDNCVEALAQRVEQELLATQESSCKLSNGKAICCKVQ